MAPTKKTTECPRCGRRKKPSPQSGITELVRKYIKSSVSRPEKGVNEKRLNKKGMGRNYEQHNNSCKCKDSSSYRKSSHNPEHLSMQNRSSTNMKSSNPPNQNLAANANDGKSSDDKNENQAMKKYIRKTLNSWIESGYLIPSDQSKKVLRVSSELFELHKDIENKNENSPLSVETSDRNQDEQAVRFGEVTDARRRKRGRSSRSHSRRRGRSRSSKRRRSRSRRRRRRDGSGASRNDELDHVYNEFYINDNKKSASRSEEPKSTSQGDDKKGSSKAGRSNPPDTGKQESRRERRKKADTSDDEATDDDED